MKARFILPSSDGSLWAREPLTLMVAHCSRHFPISLAHPLFHILWLGFAAGFAPSGDPYWGWLAISQGWATILAVPRKSGKTLVDVAAEARRCSATQRREFARGRFRKGNRLPYAACGVIIGVLSSKYSYKEWGGLPWQMRA